MAVTLHCRLEGGTMFDIRTFERNWPLNQLNRVCRRFLPIVFVLDRGASADSLPGKSVKTS